MKLAREFFLSIFGTIITRPVREGQTLRSHSKMNLFQQPACHRQLLGDIHTDHGAIAHPKKSNLEQSLKKVCGQTYKAPCLGKEQSART